MVDLNDDTNTGSSNNKRNDHGEKNEHNDHNNNTGYHYPKGHHLINTNDDDERHRENNNGCYSDNKPLGMGGGGDCHDDGELELTSLHNGNSNKEINEEDSFQDEYDDDVNNDHSSGQNEHKIGSKRTPWYGTTIVLLSEVMGTGILSLPYAAKTLGWISALIAIPTFGFFACYSGWLLSHVQSAFPNKFHSYADAASSTELFGSSKFTYAFGQFTKYCMLLNWGACAIYYLIATADGLGDITFISHHVACQYKRSILAALLLVIPCQCRDFYSISKYLSIPSTLAILMMVFILCGALLFMDDDDPTSNTDSSTTTATTLGPYPDTYALDYLEALSAFVFAYQGQAIFLELMSEMKSASEFPKSCNLAYLVMGCIYALTVIVAYGTKGSSVPEFLPDILPDEHITSSIVGILVVMHSKYKSFVLCLDVTKMDAVVRSTDEDSNGNPG